jgi:hypothetical protein
MSRDSSVGIGTAYPHLIVFYCQLKLHNFSLYTLLESFNLKEIDITVALFVTPKANLVAFVKRKICPCMESNQILLAHVH